MRRRPEGPSLPESASISCLDGIRRLPLSSPRPRGPLPPPLLGAGSQASTGWWHSSQASLLLRVSTRLNPAMRLFLGTQATLPASPANLHSHPAQSCSSLPLDSPHIVCLCKNCCLSLSSPGYIVLICRFHLSLMSSPQDLLSSQRPQLKVPFLCSPNTLIFPPKTAGIT